MGQRLVLVSRTLVLVGMLAIVITGCGRPASNSAAVRVVNPNIPTGCVNPLTANLAILSPTGTIAPNTSVTFRVSASMCQGISFHIQGRPMEERFSQNFDYIRPFPAAGTFEETIVVEAYENATSAVLLKNAVAKTTVVVNGGGTPPPPTSIACSIERIPGKNVLELNQPMSIVVKIAGPVTTTTLNGVPVVPNVEVLLSPTAPNSGEYFAVGEVSNANQKVSCPFLAKTPVCTHTVNEAYVMGYPENIKLKTSTMIKGPVANVTVNGAAANPPAMTPATLDFVNQIPYTVRGPLRSNALVISAFGDSMACGADYSANFSLAINALNVSYYVYAFGFNEITYGNRSLIGLGAGPSGTQTWSYRSATYSVPILDEGPSIARIGLCGPNEVMVGRTPWPDPASGLSMIQCALVRPELGVRNVFPKPTVWNYGAYNQCPPETTMVGSVFLPGGAGLGTLTLMCGELYQLP